MKEGLDVSLLVRDESEDEAEDDSISKICTALVSAIMFLIAPIRKQVLSLSDDALGKSMFKLYYNRPVTWLQKPRTGIQWHLLLISLVSASLIGYVSD